MPYTTPPTFADDTVVLSAAQLNILSDDIEYLYSLALTAQHPFERLFTQQSTVHSYFLRKRAQYLNIRASHSLQSATATVWGITVDVTTAAGANDDEFTDTTTYVQTTDTKANITIDLDAMSNLAAAAEWYQIDFTVTLYNTHPTPQASRGDAYFYLDYVYESDVSLV